MGTKLLAALLASFLLAPSLMAAQPASQRIQRSDRQEAASAREQVERRALIYKIVKEWGPYVKAIYGEDIGKWADRMVPTFRIADTSKLRAAAQANTFEGMTNALIGQRSPNTKALPGGIAPKAFGSTVSDLAFTPLTSCILVDTRIVGGAMTQLTQRSFKASGSNFLAQGGSATNCGLPVNPAGLLVSVSAIAPTGSGYFTLWPFGESRPQASNISFFAGQNIQNDVVIRTSQNLSQDFWAFTSGASHLVVNVLGYYATPEATALDCNVAEENGVLGLLSGLQTKDVVCPAGYTATSGSCSGLLGISVSNEEHVMTGSQPTGYQCDFVGSLLTAFTYQVNATCCRLPGR